MMNQRTGQPTHIVVGGGSAGCALAARLSERFDFRVLLIEAGADFRIDTAPADLLDTYGGRALGDLGYFWPDLTVSRGRHVHIPASARAPFFFHQARIMGGGSSINGQVALRGAPDDFDYWRDAGAPGWDWVGVQPYFRKLERDLDYEDQHHGGAGPIAIRRIYPDQWDAFTLAVADEWRRQGHVYREDLNGEFAAGFGPIPLSNDRTIRSSTALGYLTPEVRRRANLQIMPETTVRRIVVENGVATGIEIGRHGASETIRGDHVVLAAGVLHSPAILLRSGIGPAAHLAGHGIATVANLPGVGGNLHDHPLISVSAYLPRTARTKPFIRRNYSYLRHSSGHGGCDADDLVTMAVCRSSWHAIGARVATLSTYIAQPWSRGTVRLASADAAVAPDIAFNWLEDARDRDRLTDAFLALGRTLLAEPMRAFAYDPFCATYSSRVAKFNRPTRKNALLAQAGSLFLDAPGPIRRAFIEHGVTDAPRLADLLADRTAAEAYVCGAVTSAWHPVGTCRMGAKDDPAAVTDARGAVRGVGGLTVADASIMPRITRTNTNLPAIMIGEKIADMLCETGS